MKEYGKEYGRKGVYYSSGDEEAFSPIVDYPVVDTTGAGDTFSSYFPSSIGIGYSVRGAGLCK